MNSIDNLREYALTAASVNATTRAILVGYIDEIEREVAGMVPLPLDADGVPIHVGDVMEHAGYVREVAAIGKDCFFAWSDDDGRFHQYSASRFLHRAQEDVEDVLREMLDEHHRWFDGEGERTIGEMVADYAGRLRLKEG